jgi:hypothetical protein
LNGGFIKLLVLVMSLTALINLSMTMDDPFCRFERTLRAADSLLRKDFKPRGARGDNGKFRHRLR